MTRRVLIIDDETNIRRMMRLTLEAEGYSVRIADLTAYVAEEFEE